jgi:hypothetical protein
LHSHATSDTTAQQARTEEVSNVEQPEQALSDYQQFLQAKASFDGKFSEYRSLCQALQRNTEDFKKLDKRLKTAAEPEERRRLSSEIAALYNDRITVRGSFASVG